jgi:hypothetical protein
MTLLKSSRKPKKCLKIENDASPWFWDCFLEFLRFTRAVLIYVLQTRASSKTA